LLGRAILPQFSFRRWLEKWAYRIFGAAGLGVAAAGLWSARKIRAPARPTILVIGNILFDKDIAEIDRVGRFNWIYLRRLSKILENRILPKDVRVQRHYHAYLSDPKYRCHWRASERFGMALLRTLRLTGPIEAVVSSHIDYWQDEGIRVACSRLGIPFLALCHENYNVPKTFRVRSNEFQKLGFRFNGTAVATFSEHMRDMFVREQICSPNRIVVTGAPRLDIWRRVTNKPGPRIALLAFLNQAKYYASSDYFFSVLDALCALVERAEGWELVVKCKGSRDGSAVAERIEGRPNVSVTSEASLTDVLSTASIVVGGNSFSMVEALLSGAALFVADASGEPDASIFDPTDPLVAQCVQSVGSAEELLCSIDKTMAEGTPTVDHAARLRLLRRYVDFSPDEASAKRVADFIDCFIRV
jgi:hypothetical protein